MPPKPHRVLVDRVSGYASEAAAYMRRRRLTRQPFVRLIDDAGNGHDHPPASSTGELIQVVAERLIKDLESNNRN